MVEPKSYREVAIDLDAFKREVGPQFAHLNRMVSWILTTVVAAAASGGFALYTLTADLKVKLAELSTKVASMDERLKTVTEQNLSGTQKQVLEALARIETKLPPEAAGPFAPLSFTPEEERTIREFLAVKGPTKGPPGFAIGDPVPKEILFAIPDALSDRVPKLKGAKFFINNGFAIIAGAGNRAIAIVAPA